MTKGIVQVVLRLLSAIGGMPAAVVLALTTLMIDPDAGVRLALALAISFAVVLLLRIVLFRKRPQPKRHHSFIERVQASSFPSAHASRAGTFAAMAVVYLPAAWMAVTLIFCVGICASRIILRKHHLLDVVAGAAIGTVCAAAVL
ncbi:MAG: phosphatase PAP2 family protein [Nanoarchaeota archaeon]